VTCWAAHRRARGWEGAARAWGRDVETGGQHCVCPTMPGTATMYRTSSCSCRQGVQLMPGKTAAA
jgi:hypothetical protein